ncbi:MAG: biopolymer transporter ExbD [Verrucomicrobia bacterium]|nr:biopolymer transporter ExbD [Verrucomicrobiota bacterium]
MGLGSDRFEIEESDPEPDLSPMIDCVFILLIFFIVTATFVEEDGFQVNRPDAAAPATASERDTVLFLLTEQGQVIYKGRTVGVDGVQGVVRGQLMLNEESPVIIQSDPKSRHGLAMQVHNECLAGGAPVSKITHTVD